jgi:L-lactate utilization protein LutB
MKEEFLKTPFGGWGVPFRLNEDGTVVNVEADGNPGA